jgi:hypothetical protein
LTKLIGFIELIGLIGLIELIEFIELIADSLRLLVDRQKDKGKW